MEKRQHERAKYIITANRSSMVPFLTSIGNTYSLSASKILKETPMALCSTKTPPHISAYEKNLPSLTISTHFPWCQLIHRKLLYQQQWEQAWKAHGAWCSTSLSIHLNWIWQHFLGIICLIVCQSKLVSLLKAVLTKLPECIWYGQHWSVLEKGRVTPVIMMMMTVFKILKNNDKIILYAVSIVKINVLLFLY